MHSDVSPAARLSRTTDTGIRVKTHSTMHDLWVTSAALLQGNPITLRRRVRRPHRHLCSDHIQRWLMLIGLKTKGWPLMMSLPPTSMKLCAVPA